MFDDLQRDLAHTALTLARWPAWRRAATLEEMGALVVRWLDGKDGVIPWYGGSPDTETSEILGYLRALNLRGMVTTDSQPGGLWHSGKQRARVSLLASPARAAALVAHADAAGLIALCGPVRPLSGVRVPITMGARGRVTAATDGAPGPLYLPRPARRVVAPAWDVTLIDPVWGRERALWDVAMSAIAV